MSYKLPSTHIYQLLENSGGAVNTTPDLSTVIIGTLMNLVDIDIDKAKARSSDFSAWPRTVVNPDPEPEPEPEPETPILTINPVYYVDFGNNGYGFTVTGTASDSVYLDLLLDLYVTDAGGNETLVKSNFATSSALTRNSVTKVWTFKSTTAELAALNLLDTYDSSCNFKVVASSGSLERSASVTRVLSPITAIAEPVLDLIEPTSLSVNNPTWFYHYENVSLGAEIS